MVRRVFSATSTKWRRMELDGATAPVIVNVIPGRLPVIRVAGKVVSMLLFAGSGNADIGSLVSKKLNGVDFMGIKAPILTVGIGTLEIVAHARQLVEFVGSMPISLGLKNSSAIVT